MILLFDLGNSRAKWVTWADGSYVQGGVVEQGDPGLEVQLRQQLRAIAAPNHILIASVAGPQMAAAVQRVTRSCFEREPKHLQAMARQCGVQNAYADPERMGVDRWLAMLAAWNRYRCPVCVLDLGTAVTVDVIAADGRHLGGLIAPGIALAQSMLQARTAGIRDAGQVASAALGQSTGACVANGCLLSVVGTLRMALELMERECGTGGVLVATGGGAPQIVPFLQAPCEHIPNLIFDGMLLAGKDQ